MLSGYMLYYNITAVWLGFDFVGGRTLHYYTTSTSTSTSVVCYHQGNLLYEDWQ